LPRSGDVIAKEPATPDLVVFTQRAVDAGNARDIDATMSFYVLDWVQLRYAAAATWTEVLIARTTNSLDIDETRAAAERLAESRS
jgi:hypothetical protein